MDSTFCFVSHDWGSDGRNHARVELLAAALRNEAEKPVWFDGDRMTGDVSAKISKGIDNTEWFVACVRPEYIAKLDSDVQPEKNWCRQEFNYAVSRLGVDKVVLVVMDQASVDQSTWRGRLGMSFCNALYVAFFDDDNVQQAAADVMSQIALRKTKRGAGFAAAKDGTAAITQFTMNSAIETVRASTDAANVRRACDFMHGGTGGDVYSPTDDSVRLMWYKKGAGDALSSALLRWIGEDPEVVVSLLGTLSNLARLPEAKITLMSLADDILGVMSVHADNAKVMEKACKALINLAANDDNKVTLMKKNVDDALLKAMSMHADQRELVENACGALWTLASNNADNKVTLKKKNADDSLSKAMSMHADHPEVVEKARGALESINAT